MLRTDIYAAPDRRAVADVFNSAVAAAAIAAAWELGALEAIQDEGSLEIAEFAKENDLHEPSFHAVIRALASIRVVELNGQRVIPAKNFEEVIRTKSFFHWLAFGSGDLYTRLPDIMRNENRHDTFYHRNATAIATACKDINDVFFDPVFRQVIKGIEFTAVADLGCGSGERLAQLLQGCDEAHGVGIDIVPEALALSRKTAEDRGFSDRLKLFQADVRCIAPNPAFAEVDLVTCFLMGHDLWPRENCIRSMRQIRTAFPRVRRFLLGDAARTVGVPEPELPVSTLGFEVSHALMGVYLPSMDEWFGVFGACGWKCVAAHPIDTPASSVIFELEAT